MKYYIERTDGKDISNNSYLVVNTDEDYAGQVADLIEANERLMGRWEHGKKTMRQVMSISVRDTEGTIAIQDIKSLTDENARLTAQVAALRGLLEETTEEVENGYGRDTELTIRARDILNTPDPGEKYRERMATLEGIARAADLLECETCESCHCQPLLDIRAGLAEMEDRA